MAAKQSAGLYERLPGLNILFHIFVIVSGVNEHHIEAGVSDGMEHARSLKGRQVHGANSSAVNVSP